MRASFLALLWSTAAIVASSSPSTAMPFSAPTMAQAQAAIAKGNELYIKGLKDGSAAEMTALFTDDGVEMSGSGPVVKGHAALMKFWGAGAASPVTAGTIRTAAIDLDGWTAYERGTYTFTFMEKGKPVSFSGTYFTIWREQRDGSWKIRVDAGFPPQSKT